VESVYEKLLTADQAAAVLGVPQSKIYRLTSQGELRFVRFGGKHMRFLPVELEAYRSHALQAGGMQLRLPKPSSLKPRLRSDQALLHVDTLSAEEAARFLGMKLDTFYWRVRHGHISYLLPDWRKRGKRFDRTALKAYAAQHGISPNQDAVTSAA
jgi:excisionase family DNA binding protein